MVLSQFFRGVVRLAQFNDLGDTIALNHAYALFDSVQTSKQSSIQAFPKDLLVGLALMQQSYIHTIKGEQVKAFWLTQKGIKRLKKHPDYIEAQCTIHLYNYYKRAFAKYLKWLPFVNTDRTIHRQFLNNHFDKSNYFWTFYITPLIWFHFDIGDYKSGLTLAKSFLKRYPNHRPYRLIKADFLYKLKEYPKAQQEFERVLSEYETYYASHPSKPYITINLCNARGNLTRVNYDMGNAKQKAKYKALWFSNECQQWEPWLPKSLKKDLKRFE